MVYQEACRHALKLADFTFLYMHLISEFVDLILPRICPSCMNKLSLNEISVCYECLGKILPADSTRIKYEFQKKFRYKGIISGFTSLYVFEKDKEIQKIIHAMKYGNNFRIGETLGKLLGNKLLNQIENLNFDLIIPVPLHRLKKSERGYNQSFYIAKGVNNILKLTNDNKSVKRVKYTETQTSMNILEREKNISGAFKVRDENNISGKNILIIDDVITSGNTVSELGNTLKGKGARNIYAASLAIAD
jgi:ComF family protein